MKSRSVRSGLGVCASLLMLFSLPALGQVAVTTYHNDNYRSGANTQETTLTPSNVNEVQFGKRLVLPVEGYVYAQPLYVPHVSIGGISHNVVYVATEHDQVYAFDANPDSSFGKRASSATSAFAKLSPFPAVMI
jgi:hypothetical protein